MDEQRVARAGGHVLLGVQPVDDPVFNLIELVVQERRRHRRARPVVYEAVDLRILRENPEDCGLDHVVALWRGLL
eukprot:1246324-Pyramimonas_sp.AAC.1